MRFVNRPIIAMVIVFWTSTVFSNPPKPILPTSAEPLSTTTSADSIDTLLISLGETEAGTAVTNAGLTPPVTTASAATLGELYRQIQPADTQAKLIEVLGVYGFSILNRIAEEIKNATAGACPCEWPEIRKVIEQHHEPEMEAKIAKALAIVWVQRQMQIIPSPHSITGPLAISALGLPVQAIPFREILRRARHVLHSTDVKNTQRILFTMTEVVAQSPYHPQLDATAQERLLRHVFVLAGQNTDRSELEIFETWLTEVYQDIISRFLFNTAYGASTSYRASLVLLRKILKEGVYFPNQVGSFLVSAEKLLGTYSDTLTTLRKRGSNATLELDFWTRARSHYVHFLRELNDQEPSIQERLASFPSEFPRVLSAIESEQAGSTCAVLLVNPLEAIRLL